MALDLALVRFHGQTAAESAFGALRQRAGSDAPWVNETCMVEHHPNGRMALRGTFAGHYLSVDEDDHLSQPGAAVGALTGGLIGTVFLGGPVGLAPGLVLGAAIGAERGKADEVEPEPDALVSELRAAVPKGSSAIVLLAEASHDGAELEALVRSVDDTPLAAAPPGHGASRA